ncbi:L-dopachrome tautomerase yellow-f2-like [Chironomus tepperi]|uniref:L-dopachrome tautomerase yellow-f2-like n=1 Tax=Chironomus tepperi TaxID=113505 RepID=UPI00391F7B38
MKLLILVSCLFGISSCLEEFIQWNQIEYENIPETGNFQFIQYNNVPQGFAPYKDKIFVAVPRRNQGIPSTLNYVKLEPGQDVYTNPKLHSYPNYETNELDATNQANPNRIVSVYRPRVDECDRLWAVDSGVISTSGNASVIQRPSIWVFDLKTDQLVKRFEIPEHVVRDGRGLASITVDVIDCNGNSFAYIPDLLNSEMIIYNMQEDKAYRMQHNYFRMNPFEGDYDVDGLKFSWEDGIFSITLSNRDKDGYRTAYFHPMSSFTEFAVSTKILRNETSATRGYHGNDVKVVGNRGKNTQSTMHSYHAATGVIYYAQINKNAVSCWNSDRELKAANFKEVVRDDTKLIYPADLKIYGDDLYVLSNRMIRHIYSKLDTNEVNFRIFKISIKDARCSATHTRRRKYRN